MGTVRGAFGNKGFNVDEEKLMIKLGQMRLQTSTYEQITRRRCSRTEHDQNSEIVDSRVQRSTQATWSNN